MCIRVHVAVEGYKKTRWYSGSSCDLADDNKPISIQVCNLPTVVMQILSTSYRWME